MNKITSLPLVETGLLSNLMQNYLTRNEDLSYLYAQFPDLNGFEKQLISKENFSQEKRELLVSVLKSQYKDTNLSDKTKYHIEKLLDQNTYTVTTGHQLNLFTGPLYVIYKLLSIINLAEELQMQFPDKHFVPIFWMATEDHDLEEINHFWVNNQKIQWDKKDGGAVGKLNTDGLKDVLRQLKNLIKNQPNAAYIVDFFEKSYLKHTNLAEANRYLINELLGKYGLVIIDGNNRQLKAQFKNYIIDELRYTRCHTEVSKTNLLLQEKYKTIVNPREINLFYLMDGLRERIYFDGNLYKINNTSRSFKMEEIMIEVENFPERFSPNVLMRPLYQECILPNLAYIGGAGELAYWLQLKSYFDAQQVKFPILIHRNAALIINEKQQQKLDKWSISYQELFLPIDDLINKKVKEISVITIDFANERNQLENMFSKLESIATKTDKSFIGSVRAQKQKQLNGLVKLEKRLLKAEKRRLTLYVNQITQLHQEIFPKGILQERVNNITDILLQNINIIDDLKHHFIPLEFKFDIFKTA